MRTMRRRVQERCGCHNGETMSSNLEQPPPRNKQTLSFRMLLIFVSHWDLLFINHLPYYLSISYTILVLTLIIISTFLTQRAGHFGAVGVHLWLFRLVHRGVSLASSRKASGQSQVPYWPGSGQFGVAQDSVVPFPFFSFSFADFRVWRFGEETLHSCEVMLKDIEDSKRLNNAIQSKLQVGFHIPHPNIIAHNTVSNKNGNEFCFMCSDIKTCTCFRFMSTKYYISFK